MLKMQMPVQFVLCAMILVLFVLVLKIPNVPNVLMVIIKMERLAINVMVNVLSVLGLWIHNAKNVIRDST